MKYRVLIIEDELPNANRLERLISAIGDFEINGPLQTVSSSIDWLRNNIQPDIIFMDIQLIDGNCFKIFDNCTIESCVIFTTAYDQYALRAFEVNAIDYLLKPIDPIKLKVSIDKSKRYLLPKIDDTVRNILSEMNGVDKIYRKRFLVNYRDRLIPISVNDIAYFYSELKITHIVTHNNHIYTIDIPLDKIDEELDPDFFMRVTRQIIVRYSSIINIFNLYNGQIGIELTPTYKDKIHLSRERSVILKKYLDR